VNSLHAQVEMFKDVSDKGGGAFYGFSAQRPRPAERLWPP